MKGISMLLHRTDNNALLSKKGYFALLFMVAVTPLLVPNQAITGVIVNAALVFSGFTFGFRRSIIVALIPSVVGLLSGLVPIILLPMVPFIMLGNLALVGVVSYLRRYEWQGLLAGAVVKCVLLLLTSRIVVAYFVAGDVGSNILAAMGINQLFTALTGGTLAIGVRKVLEQTKE